MSRTRILTLIAITATFVSLICLLASCDALMPSVDVSPPPLTSKPAAVAEVPSVTEIQPPEPSPAQRYYYDPTNKPDPFLPFRVEQQIISEAEIITRYEVRFFRLVGVMSSVRDPKAVFEDPRGNAYVLTLGDIIGKNGGIITAIMSDEVHITETRVTILGETRTNEIVMQLHPEEELSI
ncbi:MAG: pilus assembly protein PilP [Candidatus Alcyoniella australis]|nr:pilus assembly protein PilP [Candidatus Alcyoniella australis]